MTFVRCWPLRSAAISHGAGYGGRDLACRHGRWLLVQSRFRRTGVCRVYWGHVLVTMRLENAGLWRSAASHLARCVRLTGCHANAVPEMLDDLQRKANIYVTASSISRRAKVARQAMLVLRAPMYKLAALALMAVTLPSAAQLKRDVMPEASLLASQHRASAQSIAPSVQSIAPSVQSVAPTVQSGAGSTPQASGARSFYGTAASDSSWLGSAVRMEAPRATGTGEYTKPKVVVGLPSNSMRNFMNSMGFSTEKCMLPTVKGRAKFGAGGDVESATLWVSARCTFY